LWSSSSYGDEKRPGTTKTRLLAIAALVTAELACAPFAAEARTHQISTTQKTHDNSMTASKMYPSAYAVGPDNSNRPRRVHQNLRDSGYNPKNNFDKFGNERAVGYGGG
jgi:hypothetical protein